MGDEFDKYKVPAVAGADEFAQYKVQTPPPSMPSEASDFLKSNPNYAWMPSDPKFPNRPEGIYPTGPGNDWRKDPSYAQSPVDLHLGLHTYQGAMAGAQAAAAPLALEATAPQLLGGLAGGYVGSKAGSGIAKASGAGEITQAVAGDVGGAIGGIFGASRLGGGIQGFIDNFRSGLKPPAPVEAIRPKVSIPPVSYKGTQTAPAIPESAPPPVSYSINDLRQRAAVAPQTPEGIAADRYQVVPLSGPKTPAAGPDPYTGPRTPPMEPAQSTTIASHGYHGDSQTMVVQFKNGKVYEYRGVPQNVYNQYQQSESQGSYFSQNIKGRYQTAYRGIVKPTPGQQVTQALGGPR